MPRFAANLSVLFTEHAPLDRPKAAADAGFRAVEWQFPYDVPLDRLARAREAAGVEFALINIAAGDLAKGDRGLGAIPGREDEFRGALPQTLRYAVALGVKRVNLLAGIPPADTPAYRAKATMIANLRAAAEAFGPAGIGVCIEAINTRTVPGFFLNRARQAAEILDLARAPGAGLQYDFFHMHIAEGDAVACLDRYKSYVAHIQFADPPDRHEPGTGEIDFAAAFAAVDRIGYDGWVGAEYNPSRSTLDSLAWFKERSA